MSCSPNIILLAYSVFATLVYSILGILLSRCGGKSEIGKNVINGKENVIDKTEIGFVVVDQSQEGDCSCESSFIPSISWTILEILVVITLGIVGMYGLYKGLQALSTTWTARKERVEAEKTRKADELREKIRNEERVRFTGVDGRPKVELEYSKGDDVEK